MNKQLVGLASLLTIVAVGGITYSVYRPNPNVTLADLADAGISEPTHALTCPIRASSECQTQFGIARYDWVSFGAVMSPLPEDAGFERDVLFPPLGEFREGGEPLDVEQCTKGVELLDFEQCTIQPCESAPAICAKFGAVNPFTLAPEARKCARRNSVRGFGDCALVGDETIIEMIVYPLSQTTGTCEVLGVPQKAGTCYVVAPDRAEDL
jgi:hypothetical protein